MATVGIIVNPHAGKDVRRLVSAARPTSDAVKIGIVRRVVIGALEQGAERVLLSSDTHQLAQRAIEGVRGDIEVVDGPLTSSHLDSTASARDMWKLGADAVVALGGDGTCRDVAVGWPQVPLIAISTGTNNVFPGDVDGTTAGVAAAMVAAGAVDLTDVSRVAKLITLQIDEPGHDAVVHEIALVEAALIDTRFVGSRAVTDPHTVRWVIACIAHPATTGLASIAGRLHPVDRDHGGGVVIRLGGGHRQLRVPLAPGAFTTVNVDSIDAVALSDDVDLTGGGVLALDGERTLPVSSSARISARISRSGPRMIDVHRVLAIGARDRLFDVVQLGDTHRLTGKDRHGD